MAPTTFDLIFDQIEKFDSAQIIFVKGHSKVSIFNTKEFYIQYRSRMLINQQQKAGYTKVENMIP